MGSDVQEAILAKLMLLERFNPTLYRALVEVAGPTPDGKVPRIDRVAGDDEAKKPDVDLDPVPWTLAL